MLLRGLVGSVLVLVGGLGGATLPDENPLAGWSLLASVRGTEVGRMAALAVVMLGLGLLASQWLRLCRAVGAGVAGDDDRDREVATVRRATAVWAAPLVLAPAMFSRDGWSYAAQGVVHHLGLSPYDHGPGVLSGSIVDAVDPRWMDTVAPYGPLPLWWGGLAAGLTDDPWALVVAHRLLALVGLALLAWAVPRLARWTGADPALASALVVASPLVLTSGVAGLHNDVLMVGLMAAALVAVVDASGDPRRWWWGAVLAGAAAAVKAPGGLACVGVALVTLPLAAPAAERLRRLLQVGVVSVGTVLGLGALTGLGAGWVGALGVPSTVNTPLSLTTLVGGLLDDAAGLVGPDLPDATMLGVVRQVGTLAALVAVAVLALRRPTGDRASALGTVVLVMGVLVVLSPVVHLWYLLWVTPFLGVLRLPRAAGAALVAGSVVLGLAAPLDSSLHGAYLAITMGSVLLALSTAALLLTVGGRDRVARISASVRATEGPAAPDAQADARRSRAARSGKWSASIRSTARPQE